VKYYTIHTNYATDEHQTWFNNHKINVHYEIGKHLSYTLDGTGLMITHSIRTSQARALSMVKDQLAQQTITYIFEEAMLLTQLKPVSMTLKHLKTSWGNCSRKQIIKLNYRLIECDQRFIHYVCIHELVHLKHMNHSLAFYTELSRFCPDYKRINKLTPYQLKAL
jgi:predicted metal-dependent hydrolase